MARTALLVFLFFLVPNLYSQSGPLDYSSAANWAAHPMKIFDLDINPSYTLISGDTSHKTKVNILYPPSGSTVDFFIVSPTTLINAGDKPSNIPLNAVQKSAINFAIQLNFGYLGQLGRIYAPYYRQVNLATYSMPSTESALQASLFELAANDVLAALVHYIDHDQKNKRLVLAGHSQGATVLAMVLRKMETNRPQYEKYLKKIFLSLLAGMEGGAYVALNGIKGGWLETIPFCQQPKDTACIMAWQCVKDGLPFNSNILLTNNIPANNDMVEKNLKYQPFHVSQTKQWGDPMGYMSSHQNMSRVLFPKIYIAEGSAGVTTDWIAYDNKYQARIVTPNSSAWGISILSKQDLRHDPIANSIFADLHLYDLYFVAGDVLKLIPFKMQKTTSIKQSRISITKPRIYPNPANEKIMIVSEVKILQLYLYNHLGQLVKSMKDSNTCEVHDLSPGVYTLNIIDVGQNKNVERLVVL